MLSSLLKHPVFLCTQVIKSLNEARGNGTSMISLVIPPKDQVRLTRRTLI